MAKQILTPLVLVPTGANTSGLQLSKLLPGGTVSTGSAPLGVDNTGNVVLAGGMAQTVTVDLGNVPTNGGTFQIATTNQVVGTAVTCSLSGIMPSGGYTDEFEMEPMTAYGMVFSATLLVFTVVCTDVQLLTVGKRTINYYLG